MRGDRGIGTLPVSPAALAPHGSPLAPFRRIIATLDRHLSQKAQVRAFSEDPACMLRYAPTLAQSALTLSDGTRIAPGDLVIDIHCWNERVPPMPKGGADIAWALRTASRLRGSLALLALAMQRDPALLPARAIRARVNFVGLGGSNTAVSRIIARMGFEDVDEGGSTPMGLVHDGLENLLIGALVWTHNPEALRARKLIRERRPVWSSRERLLTLHGP